MQKQGAAAIYVSSFRLLSSSNSISMNIMSTNSDASDDETTDEGFISLTSSQNNETNVPNICVALLASITTGGATYAFGFYGNELKKDLRLSQSQLDTISSATFCAGLLSWIPGMFIDRFGTRLGISLGGITGSLSLMIYWVVAKGFVEFSDLSWVVLALSMLGVIVFLSCALVTGSVFKIISTNCGPGTKGNIVGVAKGYVGLGAGAYACLFESIRLPTSSDLDFLPMAAFFFVVAAAIPSWMILPNKENEGKFPDVLTPLHFRVLYSSLFILAILIVSTSLAELYEEKHETRKETAPNHFVATGILFTWIGPILVQMLLPRNEGSLVSTFSDDEEEEENLLRTEESSSDVLQPLEKQASIEDESVAESEDYSSIDSEADRNKNLYQMIRTPEAWLMIWTTTILVGAGTVETNNLGQMVESLGFSPVVTSASLALFSVAQAGGRVATGILSENALTWNTQRCFIDKGVPRPFFLAVASIVGVFAHSILAMSSYETSFVAGIFLSGVSFGMVWPMMVLVVGELFGTAHVGANYLFFDGFTSAAGTFLLSKVVAQEVYEHHIDSYEEGFFSDSSDGVSCYGKDCFELTHIVITVLVSTCVLSSLALQYMTRRAYNTTCTFHRR